MTNVVYRNYLRKLLQLQLNRISSSELRKCFNIVCKRTQTTKHAIKNLDWNQLLSDAEKAIGSPHLYSNLKCLLNDELTQLNVHLEYLSTSKHPLLQIIKELQYDDEGIQNRSLLILLFANGVGYRTTRIPNSESTVAIYQRQKVLAVATELIHTSFFLHMGVLNSMNRHMDECLEFGNKLTVLIGDYLLAKACTMLASLNNYQVVNFISEGICDFATSEFVGGGPLVSIQYLNEWLRRYKLAFGSLMGYAFKSTLLLAGYQEPALTDGYKMGCHMGVAWQVHHDLQQILKSTELDVPFSLTSAPTAFGIHIDSTMLNLLLDETRQNYKQLKQKIVHSSAISLTRAYCQKEVDQALNCLLHLPSSGEKHFLIDLLQQLRNSP